MKHMRALLLAFCLFDLAAASPEGRSLRARNESIALPEQANDTGVSVASEEVRIESQELVPIEEIGLQADGVIIITTVVVIKGIAAWLAANKAALAGGAALIKGVGGILQAGRLTHEILSDVWSGMEWSAAFRNQMGWFGLPLTVGVVNDSPFGVHILKHEVLSGTEFSAFAESTTLQPGQEAKWEAYQSSWVDVRIAIQLSFDDGAHSEYTLQAANFRTSHWRCDTPRGGVFEGTWADVWKEQDEMCENPEGVKNKDGYYVAFFLADVAPKHI